MNSVTLINEMLTEARRRHKERGLLLGGYSQRVVDNLTVNLRVVPVQKKTRWATTKIWMVNDKRIAQAELLKLMAGEAAQ